MESISPEVTITIFNTSSMWVVWLFKLPLLVYASREQVWQEKSFMSRIEKKNFKNMSTKISKLHKRTHIKIRNWQYHLTNLKNEYIPKVQQNGQYKIA